MSRIEALPGLSSSADEIVRAPDRNRDGVLLAAIAQIGGEVERSARKAVALERRYSGITQIRKGLRHLRRLKAIKLADQRAHEILPPLCHQHPEGGKITRQLRDDDPRNCDFARDGDRMEGPCPAERNQCSVAWIVSWFGGH